MWKIWHPLPNGKMFAFVSRSGSTSLGVSAMQSLLPDSYAKWLEIPERHHGGYGHRMLPHAVGHVLPAGCVVVVREPMSRFRSLLLRTGIPADRALATLWLWHGIGSCNERDKTRLNIDNATGDMIYHFTPVTMIAEPSSVLFRHDRLEDAAGYLGISLSETRENSSDEEWPALTPAQEVAVRQAYADDIALWESLQ